MPPLSASAVVIIFNAQFIDLIFVPVTSINRSVINPLGIFTKTVREMEPENLSSRVNIRSEDELGMLAVSFNRMAEDLGKSQGALNSGPLLKSPPV